MTCELHDEVAAGSQRMRVYLYAGGETKSTEIDGVLGAGQVHLLNIRVDKDGIVSVRFE